ncbi:MAG: efflux RND transporter periplasmic adaptor subunit [Isosphaerales bacterium]
MNRRWSLLLLMLFVPVAGCQGSNAATGKPRSAPKVEYQLPIPGRVTDYAEFQGMTQAIIDVQVRARVSGYMTKVYFKDGSLVQEGDKLFQIDPQQYKAEWDRAVGNVKQIEAHKWRLEREYRRAQNLLAMAKISQEEHDRYEGDYMETDANLKLAIANRDLAHLNYEWTEVRAPTSGLLSRRLVDPGNLIKADDTILTSIVSQDPMYVAFAVDEQNSLQHVRRMLIQGKIKAKSEKEVPVMFGLSDEPGFPHAGIVDFTDNRVDVKTGTLFFRATVRNEKRILTPGLFVRVQLPKGDPHSTIFIPEDAKVADQNHNFVYVLDDNKDTPKRGEPEAKFVVKTREVTLGPLRDKSFRAIESGLKPDDKVVVSGFHRIKTGGKVNGTLKAPSQAPPKDISFQAAPADRTVPGRSSSAQGSRDGSGG